MDSIQIINCDNNSYYKNHVGETFKVSGRIHDLEGQKRFEIDYFGEPRGIFKRNCRIIEKRERYPTLSMEYKL